MGLPLLIAGKMVGRMWSDPAGKIAGYILIGGEHVIVSYEYCGYEVVRDGEGLQRARNIVEDRVFRNKERLSELELEKTDLLAMRREMNAIGTVHIGTAKSIIDCEDGEYVNHEKNRFDRLIPDPSKYGDAKYKFNEWHGLCLEVLSTKASGRKILWRDCDEEGIYVLGSNKRVRGPGSFYTINTTKELKRVRSWLREKLKSLRDRINSVKEDLERDLQMKWEVDQGLYRNISVS